MNLVTYTFSHLLLSTIIILSSCGEFLFSRAIDFEDGFDKGFIELVVKAASASNMAKEKQLVDRGWGDDVFIRRWHNDNDAGYLDNAIFIYDEGLCYVGFQGPKNLDEQNDNYWLSSTNIALREHTNEFDTCYFRAQFYDGLVADAAKFGELEEGIEKCESECDYMRHPNGCLIFTGHSHGGAIATVASFVWAKHPHRVFTFGAPPALMSHPIECDMDYKRIYRFVNAIYMYDNLYFDKVPYLGPQLTKLANPAYNVGHAIFLSGQGDNYSTYYAGLDFDAKLYPYWEELFSPFPLGFPHYLELPRGFGPEETVRQGYYDVLRKIGKNGQYPVSTKGLTLGSKCSRHNLSAVTHDLCESKYCDINEFCAPLLANGETCTENEACTSGRCNGICVEKNENGQSCDEFEDCQGRCVGGICTVLLENEKLCFMSDICASNRCAYNYVCDDKVESGQTCTYNGDCKSNDCHWNRSTWMFWKWYKWCR